MERPETDGWVLTLRWRLGFAFAGLVAVVAASALAGLLGEDRPAGALIAIGAGAGLLAVALAVATTQSVYRPVEHVRDTLSRLAKGDLTARAEHGRLAEIRAVVESLNALAQQTESLERIEGERRGAEELEREVAQAVRRHLDLDKVLRAAVNLLGPRLHVDRANIRLLSEGQPTIAAQWTAPGVSPDDDALAATAPPSLVQLVEDTLAYDGVLVIGDVENDLRLTSEDVHMLRAFPTRSLIVCLLHVGHDVVGALTLQTANEPRQWSAVELTLIDSLGGEIGIAIDHALTYRREQELVARLEELDRAKTDFVSSVSHELRTPLTSIMGYLEILEDGDAGELTSDQLAMVEIVERNSRRLLMLIEDLLTLSRVEAGRFRLSIGPVAVPKMIENAVLAVLPAASAKSISVITEVAPDVGDIDGDAAQLERALLNLLSNAVKFTPDGGRVTVSARHVEGEIDIAVTDTGIGIPLEEQTRLFERFFRSSTSQQLAVEGTGLGLAIVKSVIELHGGRAAVESTPGKGTTVRVRLPEHVETPTRVTEGARQ